MIYDSAGKTSFDPVASLTDTLKADLSSALRNLTPYATEAGGWYTIRSGNYQPTEFFFQYSGPTNAYNLDVTVTFTSYGSTAVTTAYARSQSISSVVNADGTTTHTHSC